MNKLSINESRRYASFALHVWGDQIRARRLGSLYVGNVGAGAFRPKDDPHPHCFLVCQVETTLKALGYFHYHLCLHYYAECRWLDQFRDANLEVDMPHSFTRTAHLRRMQRDVIHALGRAFIEQQAETIVGATMLEVRERLSRERRVKSNRRRTPKLRLPPQESACLA